MLSRTARASSGAPGRTATRSTSPASVVRTPSMSIGHRGDGAPEGLFRLEGGGGRRRQQDGQDDRRGVAHQKACLTRTSSA